MYPFSLEATDQSVTRIFRIGTTVQLSRVTVTKEKKNPPCYWVVMASSAFLCGWHLSQALIKMLNLHQLKEPL